MNIKTFKNVHFIQDVSGSVGPFVPKCNNELVNKFGPTKKIESITDCSFRKLGEVFNAMKKLISMAEIGDALYFVSDFYDEFDGSTNSAAEEIEMDLKSKQMSLYLHSVGNEIYPQLLVVANNTCGWGIVHKDF